MIADRNDELHFLAAVDGSEHALAAVRWIAQFAAAGVPLRCTLLNVQRPIMSGEVGAVAPVSTALAERERSAADILEGAAAILRPTGVGLALDERMDDAATAVVARAQALGCDAIVIGRRGLGSLRAALLGSVSNEVVRRSSVPVIIIGAMTVALPMIPMRILAAVDGSENALRAAAFASRLAVAAAGDLHVLHVQPSLTVASAVLGPRDQLIEHWSGRHAQEALAGVRSLLDRSRVKYTEHVVASDDPRSAILHAAQEHACGVVAMGTRGLGPVAGVLLGSVAQGVLEHAQGAATAVILVR